MSYPPPFPPLSPAAASDSAALVPPAVPRRWLWWTALVLATVVLIAGVVVAVRTWRQTGGPDGAVRGYFAALSDADASRALAYGSIPAGSRDLLSDDVLAEQQRIAPMTDFAITNVADDGDRARVSVRYTLRFAGGARSQSAVVRVHEAGGDWRLDRSAVATQLIVAQASDRVRLAGAAVPEDSALLFPGAVPLTFDTAYLELDPARGAIAADAGASTEIEPMITDAARDAVLAAVRKSLTRCLSGAATDLRCPLPDERYVPGSVRGELTDSLDSRLKIELAAGNAGEFAITGDIDVRGSYRRLEFDNRVTSRTGVDFTVPLAAHAYAVAPIVLRWDTPS